MRRVRKPRTWSLLAVLAISIGSANAGTITITDLTDGTPTVTALSNSGAPLAVTIGTDSTNEFLHFTVVSQDQIFANGFIRGRDLLEADGSVSDRLIVTALFTPGTVSNVYDVKFASDTDPGPPSLSFPSNINLIDPALNENGTVQQMFDITTVGGQKAGTDLFFVQSDVEVPEPASMALLASSLGCLAGYGWRRRKTAVC